MQEERHAVRYPGRWCTHYIWIQILPRHHNATKTYLTAHTRSTHSRAHCLLSTHLPVYLYPQNSHLICIESIHRSYFMWKKLWKRFVNSMVISYRMFIVCLIVNTTHTITTVQYYTHLPHPSSPPIIRVCMPTTIRPVCK